MTDKVVLILQLIVAFGILNVWIVRYHKPSVYRGKSARNMVEEFAAYGLPKWFMGLVGALKIACALALIAGVWWPLLTVPAAVTLAALMVGAIAMHLKVGDPMAKSLPAFGLLVMSVLIALFQ